MHATSEQMAEVMGWHKNEYSWIDLDGHPRYFHTLISGMDELKDDYWNPIENLNHAALVEARLRELGLKSIYAARIQRMLTAQLGMSTDFDWITAPAQTRCDAGWAAYSAWKERQR